LPDSSMSLDDACIGFSIQTHSVINDTLSPLVAAADQGFANTATSLAFHFHNSLRNLDEDCLLQRNTACIHVRRRPCKRPRQTRHRGIHMENFAELFFIPAMAAIILAVMVGVGLLMARREAKQSGTASSQTDEMLARTLRKAS
jgi:hypothetical protein